MKSGISFHIIIIWLLGTYLISAQTFDVVSLIENGNRDKRINFVYISEGYTLEEMEQFTEDATGLINAQFEYSPYKEYKSFFNIYLIKVPSNESGTDHPQTSSDQDCQGVPVMQNDTYFHSTFDAYGIHRLLVPGNWPYNEVTDVLMENTPFYDQSVVIVNTPYYGGSGGNYATASTHPQATAILTHEIGHSFGHLNDEYWAGNEYAQESPNMTQESDPEQIKWKKWLGDEEIGIYAYGDTPPKSEWFRPHQSCLMRFLDGQYCAVCRETLIDKIYTLVSPIDSYSPANNQPEFNGEEGLSFQVNLIHPNPDTLNGKWFLDGELIAANTENLNLNASILGSDNHLVHYEVTDDTPLSRTYNFANGYVFSVTWNVNNTSSVIDVNTTKLLYKAYPNPAGEFLYFDYTTAGQIDPVEISIFNATGQELLHKILTGDPGTYHEKWNVSSWETGIYHLQITRGLFHKTHSFIKE